MPMNPAMARLLDAARSRWARLRDLARRHPWRLLALPPALVLLYLLVLLPFTPSIDNLRKAKLAA